ncbi:MAG: hypothetical protein AAGG99_02965, partial [Pseudomonadota bacterium]
MTSIAHPFRSSFIVAVLAALLVVSGSTTGPLIGSHGVAMAAGPVARLLDNNVGNSRPGRPLIHRTQGLSVQIGGGGISIGGGQKRRPPRIDRGGRYPGGKRPRKPKLKIKIKPPRIVRPRPPKRPVRPVRPRPKPIRVVCLGGRSVRGGCVCPRRFNRVRLGKRGYACKPPTKIVKPGKICIGGRKVRGSCVCPRRFNRVRLGKRGYACKPPIKIVKPSPICRGG